MKLKKGLLAILLMLATVAYGATNDLTGLLQQGLFEEEANRNLDAAISDYQSLANEFDKNRQVAATAIFRLGECYRKLGRTNEAVAQYQRIVKEFSDQQTLATLSGQNLAGLNAAPKEENNNVWDTALLEARANEALLQGQIQQIEKMSHDEKRIFVQQNYPNSVLTEAMTQLVDAERDLIKLKTDFAPDHPKYKTAQALVNDLNAKIDAQTDAVIQGLPDKLATAQARLKFLQSGKNEWLAGYGSSTAKESTTTDDEQREVRNIQAMIQNSPDLINSPDSDGKTPLQVAAEKGQLVVAKYLLDHGADVNAGSRRHTGNPLYGAAANGRKAMVELLLSRGADVNAGVLNPLYRAISLGYTEVAEVLLANKADVNLKGSDSDGQRPLHAAARDGKTSLVQLLINHGADVNAPDNNGVTPLHSAVIADALPAAKLLLASKAEVDAQNKSGDTPLHNAAQQGSADIISLLLDSSATVDATNYNNATPLLLAVANGRAEATRVLLAHKADPNHRGGVSQNEGNYTSFVNTQPLYLKATMDNLEILKLLLDAGADLEGDSEQPYGALAGAISRNSADAVQLLLQHGANPNRPTVNGLSLLHDALANKRRSEIVSLLLDKGANPNAKDSTGFPPLFHTTDPQIARLLLNYKADVNVRAVDGQTPLMRTGDTNYLQFLLEAGAKIDLQDTNGETALHHAILDAQPLNCITILLDHKANPNIQDNTGYTPLDLVNARISNPSPYMFSTGRRMISTEEEQKIAAMLVKAGGLANLPKRDRIEVRRASHSGTTYTKGSHDWNHYSLLELIAGNYDLISQNTAGDWWSGEGLSPNLMKGSLQFPDFKKVVIYRRADNSAKQTATNVDLEEILTAGDCSRDIWLQWGDIVEVPEADHPLDQQWNGLSDQETASLTHCVSRQVTVKIKGESTTLKLASEFEFLNNGPIRRGLWRLTRPSFMLRSVLDHSKLIRVSSDLSHVKVTRHDPMTGKTMEWVVDCTDSNQADLWLRDGDVVEVPEK